ncbi:MAG: hypothetical protein HY866_20475, partial [Chloroflexi bacterium]|nr:hypothetical protein [Chloroflexota bacterium]
TGRFRSDLPDGYSTTPPPVSSTLAQYFLPSIISMEQAAYAWQQQTGTMPTPTGISLIVYQPILLAQAEVRYADRKSNASLIQDYCYQVPNVERAGLTRWEEYLTTYIEPRELSQSPFGDAAYGDLPPGLADTKRLTALKTELVDYIYKTAALILMYNPTLDLYGTPDMVRRDFIVQAQGLARQRRDAEADATAVRYDKIFDQLEAKLRKTARDLASDQKQLESLKGEELFTTGEAVLSLLKGRTTYTLSRVSRSRRYKDQARESVYGAEQVIAELEAEIEETQAKMEDELHLINEKWAQIASVVEEYRISPLKKDVHLAVFGIGWKPHWLVQVNGQPAVIPAWGE